MQNALSLRAAMSSVVQTTGAAANKRAARNHIGR
jgi:hypothetical protein